jgi:hypothetical protein
LRNILELRAGTHVAVAVVTMQRAIPLLLLAACTSNVDSTSNPHKAKVAEVSDNESTAFSYFVNKGLSDVQSAGIIGNLMQESGMDPTIYQYNGGVGRGIAQWSSGGRWDSDPGDNENDFAAQNGEDPWALNTELDFIWWELQNIPGDGLGDLQGATTVGDAVYAFMADYERCGDCAQGQRDAFANEAYSELSGGNNGNNGGGGCSVHTDGKLYCGNTTGAPIYAATNAESGVVDHLRSNPSWFDCWSTGEMHAGGNTTWYHTEGDDNGKTGFTPAVNLDTASSFDENPTAQGLRACN